MRGYHLVEARRARALRKDATSAEDKLWSRLRNRQLDGHKFVRQEPLGPYFLDFVRRKRRLVIEIDGATHSTDDELARDAAGTGFLSRSGYRVIRFVNADVFHNLDGVCETIVMSLRMQDDATPNSPDTPPPPPAPAAR